MLYCHLSVLTQYKQSKLTPEELAMRKEIIDQYSSEYALIKDLAVAGYRSPGGSTFTQEGIHSTGIGAFGDQGSFNAARPKPGQFAFGGGGPGFGAGMGGSGGGDGPHQEEITDEQRSIMVSIKANDQRFVSIRQLVIRPYSQILCNDRIK